MSFTLSFAKTDKAKNSTKIPPLGNSCQVVLKDTTSVVAPVFYVRLGTGGAPASLSALSEVNYCYCSELKRYYFITDMRSETATTVYVYCETDVLATFREDILATPAFVMYAETQFNNGIPDSRLPMCGSSRQWSGKLSIPFTDEEGCFIVTGVSPSSSGNLGSAAAIVMSAGQISTLLSKLYADNFWDSIKNDFYRPEEALMGCIWIPISYGSAVGGGASTIKIGQYDLYTSSDAKRTVTATLIANFTVPYTKQEGNSSFGDYRNFEPYSQYLLTLPGVGTVQVPMKLFAGHHMTANGTISIPIDVAASPTTGDVTYSIKCLDANGGITGNGVGVIAKGNFGVEVPLSRTVGRYASVLQGMVGGLSGVFTGAMVGGGAGAALVGASQFAGTIASSAVSGMNNSTTIVGGLGGWSCNPLYNQFMEYTTINWDISDDPTAIGKTIGRPYFHHVSSLSECSGFVQCTGAHVKTWATAQEHERIARYVNGGVSSGGILVE